MYVVERWLARLSRSDYIDDFVLKGGMLLAAFGNRRPTVDADALARNLAADKETVAARVAEIAALGDADDGVEFLTDTVTTSVIRDDALYAERHSSHSPEPSASWSRCAIRPTPPTGGGSALTVTRSRNDSKTPSLP